MTIKKSRSEIKDEEVHKVKGGLEASRPSDPNSLYPDGVDPSLADEEHNSRGQWSPYSEKQRKAAAVLIRQFQSKGMNLQQATNEAFKAVGEPEHIDEVTGGAQRKNLKKSSGESKTY